MGDGNYFVYYPVLYIQYLFVIFHFKINILGLKIAAEDCLIECKVLSKHDYITLLWTSVSEVPGTVLKAEIIII